MQKFLVLLLALCASVALAASPYFVEIRNSNGSDRFRFNIVYEIRECICLNNTQTGSIVGDNGGTIKLYSTSDCTGKYKTIGNNGKEFGAQWVKSFSFGALVKHTSGPDDYCPNWYTIN
ncbi:hypothetical protein BG005_011828 [Podila minutissima]|nr:hypothetical protein BG005_011828 [Podila minutissima]